MKRPGTALRATAGFALLNLPLIVTVVTVVWLSGGEAAEWWVRGILAVAVCVAEFAIVVTTIGPPLYEWIVSEEYVEDGEKPSWQRPEK